MQWGGRVDTVNRITPANEVRSRASGEEVIGLGPPSPSGCLSCRSAESGCLIPSTEVTLASMDTTQGGRGGLNEVHPKRRW
jgi:hypothetical protein